MATTFQKKAHNKFTRQKEELTDIILNVASYEDLDAKKAAEQQTTKPAPAHSHRFPQGLSITIAEGHYLPGFNWMSKELQVQNNQLLSKYLVY